jgi:cysteine-rich repeat protein
MPRRTTALLLVLATCEGPCVLPYEPPEVEDETSTGGPGGESQCGDGEIDPGEECDDGDGDDGDGCSNDCVASRLAFVTRGLHDGALGSLAGADDLCAAEAAAAGLAATEWSAWLASVAGSPSERFDDGFLGWYKLPSGEFLARGWPDLSDGTVRHAFDVGADGLAVAGEPRFAWSNVDGAGAPIDMTDCSGWTSADPARRGRVGSLDAADGDWTSVAGLLACDTPLRLYCFQR